MADVKKPQKDKELTIDQLDNISGGEADLDAITASLSGLTVMELLEKKQGLASDLEASEQ